jgi:hypothetical protein
MGMAAIEPLLLIQFSGRIRAEFPLARRPPLNSVTRAL